VPVNGRDKTFPEKNNHEKQRSPMAGLSGIFSGRVGISVSFVSTQEA